MRLSPAAVACLARDRGDPPLGAGLADNSSTSGPLTRPPIVITATRSRVSAGAPWLQRAGALGDRVPIAAVNVLSQLVLPDRPAELQLHTAHPYTGPRNDILGEANQPALPAPQIGDAEDQGAASLTNRYIRRRSPAPRRSCTARWGWRDKRRAARSLPARPVDLEECS